MSDVVPVRLYLSGVGVLVDAVDRLEVEVPSTGGGRVVRVAGSAVRGCGIGE